MRLFRCDWPSGDVTFLLARDERDAVEQLDEHDGDAAEEEYVTEVEDFSLTLAPEPDDEEVGWRLAALGEGTSAAMPQAEDRDEEEDEDDDA